MTTRIRGLILFLAIVWSIALAFLLLEQGSQELVDWAFRSGSVTADLGMPRASPEAAEKCAAAMQFSNESPRRKPDADAHRQVMVTAWKMGYGFGFAVALGDAGMIDEARREELLNGIAAISQALHVPVPSAAPFARSVTAIPDYGQSIEDDASCTAAFLAKEYGADISHLYKLGAVIGFAVVYRIACPECGTLLVPQIGHHAAAAGLPGDAWQTFTQLPPQESSIEERKKKAMIMVDQIERALHALGE
jgi:hypothetical protein